MLSATMLDSYPGVICYYQHNIRLWSIYGRMKHEVLKKTTNERKIISFLLQTFNKERVKKVTPEDFTNLELVVDHPFDKEHILVANYSMFFVNKKEYVGEIYYITIVPKIVQAAEAENASFRAIANLEHGIKTPLNAAMLSVTTLSQALEKEGNGAAQNAVDGLFAMKKLHTQIDEFFPEAPVVDSGESQQEVFCMDVMIKRIKYIINTIDNKGKITVSYDHPACRHRQMKGNYAGLNICLLVSLFNMMRLRSGADFDISIDYRDNIASFTIASRPTALADKQSCAEKRMPIADIEKLVTRLGANIASSQGNQPSNTWECIKFFFPLEEVAA